MSKSVRVSQLPESTLPEAGGSGASAFLYCPRCQGQYSATRGDYFWLPTDRVMTCSGQRGAYHRPIVLQLVRERRILEPISYMEAQS